MNHPIVDERRAVLGYGSDGELGVPGSTQLVGDQHVEVAIQAFGDDGSHRNTTAWDAEDQRPVVGVDHPGEGSGELLAGVNPIAVHDGEGTQRKRFGLEVAGRGVPSSQFARCARSQLPVRNHG